MYLSRYLFEQTYNFFRTQMTYILCWKGHSYHVKADIMRAQICPNETTHIQNMSLKIHDVQNFEKVIFFLCQKIGLDMQAKIIDRNTFVGLLTTVYTVWLDINTHAKLIYALKHVSLDRCNICTVLYELVQRYRLSRACLKELKRVKSLTLHPLYGKRVLNKS